MLQANCVNNRSPAAAGFTSPLSPESHAAYSAGPQSVVPFPKNTYFNTLAGFAGVRLFERLMTIWTWEPELLKAGTFNWIGRLVMNALVVSD